MLLNKFFRLSLTVKLLIIAAVFMAGHADAFGQTGQAYRASLSQTVYRVVRDSQGRQSILLNNGQTMPLPGSGVAADTVAVHTDRKGNKWYLDITGAQVDIAMPAQPYVQDVPYAPSAAQQPVVYGSSNAVPAGLGAAAGAGLGTVMGWSLYNQSKNNAASSAPVYLPYPAAAGRYYLDAAGNPLQMDLNVSGNHDVNVNFPGLDDRTAQIKSDTSRQATGDRAETRLPLQSQKQNPARDISDRKGGTARSDKQRAFSHAGNKAGLKGKTTRSGNLRARSGAKNRAAGSAGRWGRQGSAGFKSRRGSTGHSRSFSRGRRR